MSGLAQMLLAAAVVVFASTAGHWHTRRRYGLPASWWTLTGNAVTVLLVYVACML